MSFFINLVTMLVHTIVVSDSIAEKLRIHPLARLGDSAYWNYSLKYIIQATP